MNNRSAMLFNELLNEDVNSWSSCCNTVYFLLCKSSLDKKMSVK